MTASQQAGMLAPVIDADISRAWSLKTWDKPASLVSLPVSLMAFV